MVVCASQKKLGRYTVGTTTYSRVNAQVLCFFLKNQEMQSFLLVALVFAVARSEAEFVYLLHIPKTAGQSLSRDLPLAINCTRQLPRFGYERKQGRRRLSRGRRRPKPDVRWAPDTYRSEMRGLLESEGYDRNGCNVYHAEGVYEIAEDFSDLGKTRVVTLLRDPTAHLLSLYEHNRNSGFETRKIDFTNRQQPTLEQWLQIALARNTTQLGTQHNPLNMQTTRLSGSRGHTTRTTLGVYPRKRDLYRDELKPNLSLALRHVRDDAWFVGLTEFYKESLCLLRELALGHLPPECRCPSSSIIMKEEEDRRRLGRLPPLKETFNRHHSRYEDRSVTAAELKLIGAATRLDRIVHGAALARFTDHLLDAEKRHKAQILCRDGTSTLELSS